MENEHVVDFESMLEQLDEDLASLFDDIHSSWFDEEDCDEN